MIPTKLELCPVCEGRGVSSAYLGAYTQDELDEAGPEFLEDYVNGVYDRACDRCDGLRVVEVPDLARCTPEQIRELEEELEYERTCAMERLLGC